MKIALNHISIVVKDLDQATKMYADLLGCKPPAPPHPYSTQLIMDEPGIKQKIQLLEMQNNSYIELVQPIKGPRLKTLEENGEGAVYQIGFRVDDIEKTYDELRTKGITPVTRNGPLTDRKYGFGLRGEKLFFIPPARGIGPSYEFVQRDF